MVLIDARSGIVYEYASGEKKYAYDMMCAAVPYLVAQCHSNASISCKIVTPLVPTYLQRDIGVGSSQEHRGSPPDLILVNAIEKKRG